MSLISVVLMALSLVFFFFFKQKTAYEISSRDWSSDVCSSDLVDPADGRLLDGAGRPHPRRFALGPYTDGRTPGAFTRPRTGGPAFRQNDATARAALVFLHALAADAAA